MSKPTCPKVSRRKLSQGIGCCWFQCKTGLWLGRCSADSIVRNSWRWCLNSFMTHSCIIDLLLFAEILLFLSAKNPLLEMFAKLLSFTDAILHLRSEFWLLFVHSALLYQVSSWGWQVVSCDKLHKTNATVTWFEWDGQGRDRWSEWVLGGICNVLLDVLLLCYFCLTNIYFSLLD